MCIFCFGKVHTPPFFTNKILTLCNFCFLCKKISLLSKQIATPKEKKLEFIRVYFLLRFYILHPSRLKF